MLVLSRQIDEEIVVETAGGTEVLRILVVDVRPGAKRGACVRLGIKTAERLLIYRAEFTSDQVEAMRQDFLTRTGTGTGTGPRVRALRSPDRNVIGRIGA